MKVYRNSGQAIFRYGLPGCIGTGRFRACFGLNLCERGRFFVLYWCTGDGRG